MVGTMRRLTKELLFVVLLESYTLKLGILVHKRKFTGKEHQEHNIYMYIVCWIVGTL